MLSQLKFIATKSNSRKIKNENNAASRMYQNSNAYAAYRRSPRRVKTPVTIFEVKRYDGGSMTIW